MMVTDASSPTAMRAALVPETPPPSTTTCRRHARHATQQDAGAALLLSRQCAPTCTAMRPATSLIGDSSGSPPARSVTVS